MLSYIGLLTHLVGDDLLAVPGHGGELLGESPEAALHLPLGSRARGDGTVAETLARDAALACKHRGRINCYECQFDILEHYWSVPNH